MGRRWWLLSPASAVYTHPSEAQPLTKASILTKQTHPEAMVLQDRESQLVIPASRLHFYLEPPQPRNLEDDQFSPPESGLRETQVAIPTVSLLGKLHLM